MGTLYHYIHCPYCIRVRMVLGFLKQEFTSIVLPYDDEATPISLIGEHMLPIWKDDSITMPESIDIIAYLDKKESKLQVGKFIKSNDYKQLSATISELSNIIHSLAMPYWIYTPEFNEKTRQYFKKEKELKRGAFSKLVKKQEEFKQIIQNGLLQLEQQIYPFYHSATFNLGDILLAAHLWGLYIVPEFQFSPVLHYYLQSIKKICKFDYHLNFWTSD